MLEVIVVGGTRDERIRFATDAIYESVYNGMWKGRGTIVSGDTLGAAYLPTDPVQFAVAEAGAICEKMRSARSVLGGDSDCIVACDWITSREIYGEHIVGDMGRDVSEMVKGIFLAQTVAIDSIVVSIDGESPDVPYREWLWDVRCYLGRPPVCLPGPDSKALSQIIDMG